MSFQLPKDEDGGEDHHEKDGASFALVGGDPTELSNYNTTQDNRGRRKNAENNNNMKKDAEQSKFADTRENENLGSELVSIDVSESKASKISNFGQYYQPQNKQPANSNTVSESPQTEKNTGKSRGLKNNSGSRFDNLGLRGDSGNILDSSSKFETNSDKNGHRMNMLESLKPSVMAGGNVASMLKDKNPQPAQSSEESYYDSESDGGSKAPAALEAPQIDHAAVDDNAALGIGQKPVEQDNVNVAEKPQLQRRLSQTFENMQLKLKADGAKEVLAKFQSNMLTKFRNIKEKQKVQDKDYSVNLQSAQNMTATNIIVPSDDNINSENALIEHSSANSPIKNSAADLHQPAQPAAHPWQSLKPQYQQQASGLMRKVTNLFYRGQQQFSNAPGGQAINTLQQPNENINLADQPISAFAQIQPNQYDPQSLPPELQAEMNAANNLQSNKLGNEVGQNENQNQLIEAQNVKSFEPGEMQTKFKVETLNAPTEMQIMHRIACHENLFFLFRVLGSLIVCADTLMKLDYGKKSKFSSLGMKHLYFYMLTTRPICIFFSNLYNWCVNIKISIKKSDKIGKKYKDDVAWQKEEADRMKNRYINGKLVVVPKAQKQQQPCEDNIIMITIRHIELYLLTYSGFVRLLQPDSNYSFALTVSGIAEMYLQAVPLSILQYFNDDNLNKEWGFVRTCNMTLSVLTVVDLGIMVLYSQKLDRTGTKYHLIGSEYDLADELEKQKKAKEKKKEKREKRMNQSSADQKIKAGKLLLKAQQFGTSIDSISNCHTKCMAVLKLPEFALLFVLLYSFVLYPVILQSSFENYQIQNADQTELASLGQGLFQMYSNTCEMNTYEREGEERICYDCLAQLGVLTCLNCDEQKFCLKCREGFTQIVNENGWGLCEKCQDIHGPQCVKCTQGRNIKKYCTECSGNYVIDNGKCVSCTEQTGCLKCDSTGCQQCEEGYFRTRSSADKPWQCEKCSSALSYCETCSNKTTCTKCTHDYFKLWDDGKCKCSGGSRSIVDNRTGKCSCARGFYLTDQGCVTCSEAIRGCGRCYIQTRETQIPMADEFLQPNGKYLQCMSCAGNELFPARRYGTAERKNLDGTIRQAKVQGFSFCINCDAAQVGCKTCTRYTGKASGIICNTCEKDHYVQGSGIRLQCINCGYMAKNCGSCTTKECTQCKDGYFWWLSNCEKNWV